MEALDRDDGSAVDYRSMRAIGSEALGKQQLSHIRLTSSKTHISRDDIQSEHMGVGRLTPIVHHQKSALRLLHNQGTGFKTLAQQDQGTEILFKKRLTDVKRSSEAKLQPRVQQLSIETMESDSPKGLDRALSPAMLAALKLHRSQRRPDTPPTGSGSITSEPLYPEILDEDYDSSVSHESSVDEEEADEFEVSEIHAENDAVPSQQIEATGSASSTMTGSSPSTRRPTAISLTSSLHDSPVAIESVGTFGDNFKPIVKEYKDVVTSKVLPSITTSRPYLGAVSKAALMDFRRIGAQKSNRGQELVRTNISRVNERSMLGLVKQCKFEMFTMKGRRKLTAMKDGRNSGYTICMTHAGKDRSPVSVATLIASTFAENHFLLIGSTPSSPQASFDPEQDPVIMAVSFDKNTAGQRTAVVLLPDDKKIMTGCPDLGSKQHIRSCFEKHSAGRDVRQAKVLVSVDGKQMKNARSTKPSVKNIQLQEAAPSSEDSPVSEGAGAEQKDSKCCFEFGKLRHNNEFVCDFVKPLLNPVQAMGLAIACCAPKRTFLYL